MGGSELHAGVTSAAVRFRHCMLVAAAAAPPECGRHGGRLLQLRVITLGGHCKLSFHLACCTKKCCPWPQSRRVIPMRVGCRPKFVPPRSNCEAAARGRRTLRVTHLQDTRHEFVARWCRRRFVPAACKYEAAAQGRRTLPRSARFSL